MLIYGILYVQDILGKIRAGMSRRDAEKAVMNVALDTNFAIPGDAGFPLNALFEAPKDRFEAETLRQYVMQMRQELAGRLLGRVYGEGDQPSKVSFCGRSFLAGVELGILMFLSGGLALRKGSLWASHFERRNRAESMKEYVVRQSIFSALGFQSSQTVVASPTSMGVAD